MISVLYIYVFYKINFKYIFICLKYNLMLQKIKNDL